MEAEPMEPSNGYRMSTWSDLPEEERERLQEAYRERGVPSEWQEITPPNMLPAFRMFYRALPSPSADFTGTGESEELIHNPVAALRRAGIIPPDETPRISTMVVNHQATLERFMMSATVVASTNPTTVGIMIVKEPWTA
jgi:hypothetical protein